jgi:hypothetical protein
MNQDRRWRTNSATSAENTTGPGSRSPPPSTT